MLLEAAVVLFEAAPSLNELRRSPVERGAVAAVTSGMEYTMLAPKSLAGIVSSVVGRPVRLVGAVRAGCGGVNAALNVVVDVPGLAGIIWAFTAASSIEVGIPGGGVMVNPSL